MNAFQKLIHNIEGDALGAKLWLQNHMHMHHGCKNECSFHQDYDSYTQHMHWYYFAKFLPEEMLKEIHTYCMHQHELFLSDHFLYAKKIKELKHRVDMLLLDLQEQYHSKKETNKKFVSETLAELMKVKLEMDEYKDKEREKYMKSVRDTENHVYNMIQEHLKK